MSQTLSESQLIEIRRVKAMVAGAGNTINPQCFLGPTGPPGPTGPSFTFVFNGGGASNDYTSGPSFNVGGAQ
jgi:hypothetical protein